MVWNITLLDGLERYPKQMVKMEATVPKGVMVKPELPVMLEDTVVILMVVLKQVRLIRRRALHWGITFVIIPLEVQVVQHPVLGVLAELVLVEEVLDREVLLETVVLEAVVALLGAAGMMANRGALEVGEKVEVKGRPAVVQVPRVGVVIR